jgi:hypothetical protein
MPQYNEDTGHGQTNLAEGQRRFSKIAEIFSQCDRATRKAPDSHSINVLLPTPPEGYKMGNMLP